VIGRISQSRDFFGMFSTTLGYLHKQEKGKDGSMGELDDLVLAVLHTRVCQIEALLGVRAGDLEQNIRLEDQDRWQELAELRRRIRTLEFTVDVLQTVEAL
jgi:hypothetical protein